MMVNPICILVDYVSEFNNTVNMFMLNPNISQPVSLIKEITL